MYYESEMDFLYEVLEESKNKAEMEIVLDSIDYLMNSEV